MSETLSRHRRAVVLQNRMQPFSNTYELLAISRSHKNFVTISQTVEKSSRWQTYTPRNRHYWKQYHRRYAIGNDWQQIIWFTQKTNFQTRQSNV